MGFVATKLEKQRTLAGFLADAVVGVDLDASHATLLQDRDRQLPVPLLADLDPLTTWYNNDDIDRIELNCGRLKIVGPAVTTAVVPPEADPRFHHWADQVDIHLHDPQGRIEQEDDPNKRLGLWRRIFR